MHWGLVVPWIFNACLIGGHSKKRMLRCFGRRTFIELAEEVNSVPEAAGHRSDSVQEFLNRTTWAGRARKRCTSRQILAKVEISNGRQSKIVHGCSWASAFPSQLDSAHESATPAQRPSAQRADLKKDTRAALVLRNAIPCLRVGLSCHFCVVFFCKSKTQQWVLSP